MKHETKIDNDILKEFSLSICNLRYDYLVDFIRYMSQKLHDDSVNDKASGKILLARKLKLASAWLDDCADEIADAWDICEQKMKE